MIFSTIFMLLFLIVILATLFIIFGLRHRKRTIFNVTSKVHFTVLKIFIGLLLVMTIAAEWFYPSSEASDLPPKATVNSYDHSVFNDVINGKKPDASMLVAERLHEIGDHLTIELYPNENDRPDILIERKEVNDGVIEEYIYEPTFIFNGYNFSSKIGVTLPRWQEDTLTILEEPALAFEFVFFENTALLNQLINLDDREYFSSSFSSSLSAPVIHLIVPKDLEIIDVNDHAIFVEEWRNEEP